jgi:hypothetical protein
MTLKATEVFTPGSFPVHTYVERSGERLEQSLRDAIDTPGQLVSLVGPSKSGKTVLVEKVVGRDQLITITGAGITAADDIWTRVLDWMDTPESQSDIRSTGTTLSAGVGTSGSSSLLGFAKAGGELNADAELTRERGVSVVRNRRGLPQVVDEIGNSAYVVLVDDFHYMPRDVQSEAAKTLKEAVRLGVKVCTAAVRHRGDDLVRANPELRGRVRSIDLEYWRNPDLRQIATAGCAALNLTIDDVAVDKLVLESAGSPQLMQLLCLNVCFVLGHREKSSAPARMTISPEQLSAILGQTSSSTDFRSMVDVIDAGPKTRGTERKIFRFVDGSTGDVYRCVLKAVASDPPRLALAYDELTRRTAAVCVDESPVGSAVTGTCLHMSRLAQDKFPNERALDWDEQKQILDIPDPYLLFYLRWSGHLASTND